MANWGKNIISGAGTGAALGAASGNPFVALGGGILGALGGVFASMDEEDDEDRKREILEKAKEDFGLTQDQIDTLMEEYYTDPTNFLGTQADVTAYRNAVSSYNPNDFVYNFDPYEYDKSVDDFLNPYYDKIISDTEKRISHSSAGAGVGRGTGAANAIATGVAQKENELYNTALNQYNTDRAQKYSEWSGNIQAMQNRLNQLKSASDTKLNMQGNLAQDYVGQRQNYMRDQIDSMQNRNNGNLQLASMGLMI